MSVEHRDYWGFSPEAKKRAHERAGDRCEFPEGCGRKNTGQVNHITGSLEGRLAGFPREVIQDIDLNSALLCRPHEVQHDIQEANHVALLGKQGIIYEARSRGRKKHMNRNGKRFARRRR